MKLIFELNTEIQNNNTKNHLKKHVESQKKKS